MGKQRKRDFDDYVPVELRHRADGWTAARQVDFLLALSESGCVEEACRVVGKSTSSAYALRRRVEAVAFRQAWDAAMDYAISRLADAAISRALHGIARPVFYKGELIGERRYYDERLTMFLLRLRDPARFGGWRERTPFDPPGDLAKIADGRVDAADRESRFHDRDGPIFPFPLPGQKSGSGPD